MRTMRLLLFVLCFVGCDDKVQERSDLPLPDESQELADDELELAESRDDELEVFCMGPEFACQNCETGEQLGAVCVAGAWTCPSGTYSVRECFERLDPCSLYGGEVCCAADGSITEARCVSPSQPKCYDGSLAQAFCPGSEAQCAEASEGAACTSLGLGCALGYEPIECGGITLRCDGSNWVELYHTDPGPGCFP